MNPATIVATVKKTRVDGQVTGLAGESFVAAELLKRGLQTSLPFGNAKQIDLFAHNPETGVNFNVQVKSLRYKNWFPIRAPHPGMVYVFVILNKPGESVNHSCQMSWCVEFVFDERSVDHFFRVSQALQRAF